MCFADPSNNCARFRGHSVVCGFGGVYLAMERRLIFKRPYFFFAAFFLVAFFLVAFFALAAMINLHVGLVPGRVFTEMKYELQ
jgi:hypothetical protein